VTVQVKLWLTFNEPFVIVWQGYGNNEKAPGIYAPEDGAYRAGHVLLKAHAEAWHLYNDVYRATQGGE
jgi:lactase-phlorizin hydrolase